MVESAGTGLAILQLIICASRIPITMVSWLIETKAPLIFPGVTSAMYMGERVDASPMPIPPDILNITNNRNEEAAPVPREATTKITAARRSSLFLPNRSLSHPDKTAPARHPMSAQLIAHPCMAGLPLIPK